MIPQVAAWGLRLSCPHREQLAFAAVRYNARTEATTHTGGRGVRDLTALVRISRPVSWRAQKLARSAARGYYTALARSTVAVYGPGLRVNGRTRLTSQTHLGSNVHMNGLEISGHGTVRIGDNFHSGPDCLFIAQNHDYDHGDAVPYDSTYVHRDISVGDNVWLGARVIVLGGVEIGDGAIIQAGSCVVADVPRCAVAGGHPARVFRHRDIEHYERLVAAGRFH